MFRLFSYRTHHFPSSWWCSQRMSISSDFKWRFVHPRRGLITLQNPIEVKNPASTKNAPAVFNSALAASILIRSRYYVSNCIVKTVYHPTTELLCYAYHCILEGTLVDAVYSNIARTPKTHITTKNMWGLPFESDLPHLSQEDCLSVLLEIWKYFLLCFWHSSQHALQDVRDARVHKTVKSCPMNRESHARSDFPSGFVSMAMECLNSQGILLSSGSTTRQYRLCSADGERMINDP